MVVRINEVSGCALSVNMIKLFAINLAYLLSFMELIRDDASFKNEMTASYTAS